MTVFVCECETFHPSGAKNKYAMAVYSTRERANKEMALLGGEHNGVYLAHYSRIIYIYTITEFVIDERE